MRIFLTLIILFQHIFLYGCQFPNQLGKNQDLNFSKKSIPDANVCNDTSIENISVSKTKLAKLPNNPKDYVTITTNIPNKLIEFKKIFNGSNSIFIDSVSQNSASFIVRIYKNGSDKFFEKTIDDGCASFDWDGADTNGNFLGFGNYTVAIFFSYIDINYKVKKRVLFNIPSGIGTQLENITNTFPSCSGVLKPYCDPTTDKAVAIFTADEIAKQIESTNIELVETQESPPLDPVTTRFFEVDDFKKLSDYANQLNIDDSQANELYNQAKLLDVYQKEKISLLARSTINQAKIDAINSKIQSANDSITALQGSVMVQLSDLYNNAYNLANHVNTITESQYITPYPPDEKPTTSSEYYDKGYFSIQNIETYLAPLSFYEPDLDNPNQTNLSVISDLEHSRSESLDPENIFKSSKYIFEEIQTSKYLVSDISSNIIIPEEKSLALETLGTLLTQLKKHLGLLKTKSKDFNSQYGSMVNKISDLQNYTNSELVLTLGSIIENIDDYDDATFRLKSISSKNSVTFGNSFDKLDKVTNKYTNFINKLEKFNSRLDDKKFKTKSLDDIKKYFSNISNDIKNSVTTKVKIIESYKNSSLPKEEKVLGAFLSIDKAQWEKIKQEKGGQKLIDDLVKSFEELIDEILKNIPSNEQGNVSIQKIIESMDAENNKSVTKTRINTSKNKAQLSKKVDLVKIIKSIDKLTSAYNIISKVTDFYHKIVPVRKAASKYCYSFSQTVPVDPNYTGKKCINELGGIVIDQRGNTTLKNRYNLPNNKKVYPAGEVLGSLASGLEREKDNPIKFEALLVDYLPRKPIGDDLINNPWKQTIYNEALSIFHKAIEITGIPIVKINLKTQPVDTEIYAPNFKPLLTNGLNGSKKFVVELNNINGTYGFGAKDSDFRRANEKLITQLDLKDKAGNLIDRKLLDNYIDNKFTWHHHENIREMILLPRKIHSIQLKHWGATMIFDNTKNNPILRNKWETSLVYN